jgi:hypothetical protein
MEKQYRPRLSETENQKLKRIRSGNSETHIVIGCVHAPYHNEDMMFSIMGLMSYFGKELDGLHLIGDIQDMRSISRHNKDQIIEHGLTLEKEYELTNSLLDLIDMSIENPKIRKTYIWGNHEDWYNQHLKNVNAAKLGRGVIKSPTEACFLKSRGYEVYEDWRESEIQLGDLTLIHGIWTNEHSAKKHTEKVRGNVMYAHTHRMQMFDDGDRVAYNIGFAGDIKSKAFSYVGKYEKAAWRNGFAVVHIDEYGKSHVTMIKYNDEDKYFVYDGIKF